MKTLVTSLFLICMSTQIKATNVAITDSFTGDQWEAAALNLGYNVNRISQGALHDISNLEEVDVLVISKATIPFGTLDIQQNIEQFVMSGRALYITSEYQMDFQGNIAFETLLQSLGVDFSWTEKGCGSLTPMNILGDLSTTPNEVTELNYFNFGFAGIGDGVEEIMEYDGSYYGFCYSDTIGSNGTVITVSDGDWAQNNASPDLMENILFKLANSVVTPTRNLIKDDLSLKLYPNPITTEVTIKFDSYQTNLDIEIYNSIGEKVKNLKDMNGEAISLRRDNLPQGVYFIRIEQNEYLLKTETVIITNN